MLFRRLVYTVIGIFVFALLSAHPAQAQCGFNAVGDYICPPQGGGQTAPRNPFKPAKPSPVRPDPAFSGTGAGGGVDYQAKIREIKRQMAADQAELDATRTCSEGGASCQAFKQCMAAQGYPSYDCPLQRGGASPCAGEEVVSVDFTSDWKNNVDGLKYANERGGGTATGGHNINGNQCLRVTYPKGKAGDGYSFRAEMPPSDHYIQSYDVMFGQGLDFVKGGKLAGMFGGVGQTGGKVITDGSGFSTRVMWRKGGRAQAYVYHAKQPGTWGDGATTANPVFTPGQLHNVTVETIMNDPGIANGVMRIWVDGNLVVEETKYLFRYDNSLQIDAWGIGTIFGGSTPDFAPTKDEKIFFCNMRIYAGDTAQCSGSQQ